MGKRIEPFKHQLEFDEQRSLYDYWRSKCRPGVLPGRGDLHPRDMIQLLPFITLTDVVQNDARRSYRIRLAGTGLRTVLETEITGKTLDDLPFGLALPHWRQVHDNVVEDRKPLCGVTPLIWHKGGKQALCSLAQFWVKFPLANENGTVSAILAYDIFMPLADLSPGLQLHTFNE